MPNQSLLPRVCFLVWLVVLGLGVHYGRRLAPWLEGANAPYTLAGLLLAGLAGLAWAGWRLDRHRAAWPRLLPGFLGLALLGWAQPLMIERLHVLLYGITGLLAWALFPGRLGWRRGWPAAGLASVVGLVDELAQALHPQRVGDWRDVVTNAAAALLAIWLAVAVQSSRQGQAGMPAPETGDD